MTDKDFWKNIAEKWCSGKRSYDDHGEAVLSRWLDNSDSRISKKYKKNPLDEEEDDDDW